MKNHEKTKLLVTMGLMVAIHIILSRWLSINAWNLKIGFAFVPVFIAAWAFGPVPAAVVGGLGDFLGALLFPIGPYFPGFTLSCALTGAIFGVLLHKEQTMPRIVTAVVLNQFGVSLLLSSFWISMLYGTSYTVLLETRVIQSAILTGVELITITTLTRSAAVLRRQFVKSA